MVGRLELTATDAGCTVRWIDAGSPSRSSVDDAVRAAEWTSLPAGHTPPQASGCP
ncbi:hypothetical protein [Nitrospirillum sp. BR 11163]|uniref:hypothetical protein n=1 Tax=Nitrospirillum sp. BR 11163 TaxID=3104323 RepID=UPI002AFEA376|nr:hypothetical protein [Nitrospirillum sp. BR 11163]MEA1672205.1 hypothetical protein [Nitrospirillum sp. BR 11163]